MTKSILYVQISSFFYPSERGDQNLAQSFQWGKSLCHSLTLMSISEYIFLRSCITQSRYSSPVPRITCSPDSSTWKRREGFSCSQFPPPRLLLKPEEGSALNTLVRVRTPQGKLPQPLPGGSAAGLCRKLLPWHSRVCVFLLDLHFSCYFYIIYEITETA